MIKKNKRGISPLIATVLIIGFTVILAFIIITWINSNVGDLTCTQSCEIDGGNVCSTSFNEIDLAMDSGNGYVTVTNLGSTDFETLTVVWVGADGATDCVEIFSGELAAYGNVEQGPRYQDNPQCSEWDGVDEIATIRAIVGTTPEASEGCDACEPFNCPAVSEEIV
jgi:flagellin-like protein